MLAANKANKRETAIGPDIRTNRMANANKRQSIIRWQIRKPCFEPCSRIAPQRQLSHVG